MKLSTKVRTWLIVASDGGATRADLCTANEHARLATWPIGPETKSETSSQRELRLEALSHAIAAVTRTDAKTQIGLRATYVLASYKAAVNATVRFPDYMHRLSVDAPASGGAKQKGDTITALTAQLQAVIAAEQARSGELHRLLLATHQQWGEANQQIVNRTMANVEKNTAHLVARIEGYEKRHLEQLALTDRLLSMQADREAAREQAALDKEKHAFTREKLDLLVPVLLNRIMGGGPSKGTPFFGEEMLQRLLGGLKPEQVDQLMRSGTMSLSPEQLMIVGELYMSYGERADAAKKRGLNGAPTSPEASAEPPPAPPVDPTDKPS
jgi:hypothetical protein